jgi:hypothetical protein
MELIASRPVERPKIRLMDNVMKDIQATKIVNWKKCAQDRNKWNSELQLLVGSRSRSYFTTDGQSVSQYVLVSSTLEGL